MIGIGLLLLDFEHAVLRPTVGELLGTRYRRWEPLGVLSGGKAARPHSAFLLPRAVLQAPVLHTVL